MATFLEMQATLKKLTEEKAILIELIDHLEKNFLCDEVEKLKVIITDDHQKVPQEMVEAVLENVLLKRAKDIDADIAKITQAPMVDPLAPPPVAEPDPAALVEESVKKSKK